MSVTTGAIVVRGQGRIVLPAGIRRELDIKPGDRLIPVVENGELRLLTYAQIDNRIHEAFKPARRGTSAVDDLIAERREEFLREEAEGRRYGA